MDVRNAALVDQAPARRSWWKALLADRGAMLALLVLTLIVLAAVFAPLLAPFDPNANSRAVMQPPAWSERGNWQHILGTDGQGRDILSRILYGTRLTLLIALVAIGIGGVIGSGLGLLSSMYPRLDPWVMRLNDMMLSFPAILLGLAMVAVFGPGVWPIILALAVASIPDCARIARSIGIGVMSQEYIEAGRAVGLTDWTIFRKYLLRNSISSIMIFLSLRFGQVILIGAALSFLGLGARPPASELGMMAAQGRDFLLFAPHIVAVPSVAIFIIVLCANVTGDALRDVLDPRLKS
ncbi:ABC transporter permease [Aquamicrobium sp. LC103]|uniref:ABC transporter permease n=1 Tax=Aquamicrobium sp. LC103 TaxID=1120658 RepID=UPI00063ED160|nr:ABC transporter permease [Aquamicrobium sp. LC103]